MLFHTKQDLSLAILCMQYFSWIMVSTIHVRIHHHLRVLVSRGLYEAFTLLLLHIYIYQAVWWNGWACDVSMCMLWLCAHRRACVCTYVCVHVFTCVHLCAYLCLCACICTCLHTCVHMCVKNFEWKWGKGSTIVQLCNIHKDAIRWQTSTSIKVIAHIF